MSARANNAGLTREPLFVGATRPPMRWGVTYSALLFNLIFTIVENCGNTLILRCSGSEQGGTSMFASRLIGEREVMRTHRSRGSDRDGNFGARSTRRSVQLSEQYQSESAVLASEVEQLPDLRGYLKTASSRRWKAVALDHRN